MRGARGSEGDKTRRCVGVTGSLWGKRKEKEGSGFTRTHRRRQGKNPAGGLGGPPHPLTMMWNLSARTVDKQDHTRTITRPKQDQNKTTATHHGERISPEFPVHQVG